MTMKDKLMGAALAALISCSGAALAASGPPANTMGQTHAQPMTPMAHSEAMESPREERMEARHHRRHHRSMRHHAMHHRHHAMHHAMNNDAPMAHPMTTTTHH